MTEQAIVTAIVVRIDQGDYLVERAGYDWGRNLDASARWPKAGATVYRDLDAAQAAVKRLGLTDLVRAYERADY